MTTQTQVRSTVEALKHEINLVLTDPDTNLSHGAKRALDYVLGQLEALAQRSVTESHKQRSEAYKPLTDEEITDMWQQYNPLHGIASFARAIEAAHGIKE